MRRVLAAVVASLVLGAVAPLLSSALETDPPARLASDLAGVLSSADADERLVVAVHGANRRAALDGIDDAGLTVIGEFRSIGVPVAVGSVDQVAALAEAPGISYLEQDRPVQLHLDSARRATRAAEAAATPELAFTGAGQTIAIVDGGVDGTHPMFADATGASRVVRNLEVACFDNIPGLTFAATIGFDPATCPGVYVQDEDGGRSADEPFIVDFTDSNDTDTNSAGGHGTHVAGIAAGSKVTTSTGRVLKGLAPDAKIVALSMGAAIGIFGADAALDWVARHHDDPCGDGSCPPITVVNNSYGSGGDWDPESVTSKIQRRLLERGVVMVWANGNSGGNGASNASGSDAAAQIPGVISVANYDDGGTGTRDGELAPSSSRGEATKPLTWPDVSAPGTAITSACRVYLPICSSAEADPNYGTIGGTSMAAPHVAGLVALIRQANPALTPPQIELLLENTTYRFSYGAPYAPDPTNPSTPSSFDKGHGLIDAVHALHAAVTGEVVSTDGPIACGPGTPVLLDELGDATQVASVNAGLGPNEPALDLRELHVRWDAAAKAVDVVIAVHDLKAANPGSAPSASWNATFVHDGSGWYVEAARDASGAEHFGWGVAVTVDADVTKAVQRVPLGTIEGSFDPTGNAIRMRLPSALLEEQGAVPLRDGAVLSGFAFASRRAATTQPIGMGAAADQSATENVGCPFTIVDPSTTQPTPQRAVDATIADGQSFETEATNGATTTGAPFVGGHTCDGLDDPTCFAYDIEVVPGPSGSTLNVWLEPTVDGALLDDWDLYLYDPAGNELPGVLLGLQTTEEIIGISADVSARGVYTILVNPYSVPEGVAVGVHADLIASD